LVTHHAMSVISDFSSLPPSASAAGISFGVNAESTTLVQVILCVPACQVEALYSYAATLHKRVRKVPAKPKVDSQERVTKTTPTASVVSEITNLAKASKLTRNKDVRAVLTAAVEQHATSLAARSDVTGSTSDFKSVKRKADVVSKLTQLGQVPADLVVQDPTVDVANRKLAAIERTNDLKETELKMKAVELKLRQDENRLKIAPSADLEQKRKQLLGRYKRPIEVTHFYCYQCKLGAQKYGRRPYDNYTCDVKQLDDCKNENCGEYDKRSLRVIAGFEKRFSELGLDFWVDGPGVSVKPTTVSQKD
jgi:hypothetical protein